jgi:hypothetical protein
MQFTQAVLVGGALLVGNVDAFWRMPCLSRSGLARIDPLVNPGATGAHVHAIHGSSGKSLTRSLSRSSAIKWPYNIQLHRQI